MRRTRIFTIMLLSVLCIAVSSCKKKEILTFGGQMDKFVATNADGSKTYLGHAEEWLYWETGDDIMAYVGGAKSRCELVSGSGTLNAFFKSQETLPYDENNPIPFYAIYPSTSGGNTYNDLFFPAEQPYREVTSPQHPDSSFGRGAMPMVAYEVGGSDQIIHFHVVAGILRIQLYSRETKNIESITFEEVSDTPKQISGLFAVHDITKNQPWLTTTDASTLANQKIEITGINEEVGPNQLLTFYLPLPSLGTDAEGSTVYTHYKLKMTVKSGSTYCQKTLGADIHRRNITMMPALYVDEWTSDPSSSTSNVTLVGSGTKDRPFQIYTAAELEMVRSAFATANPTINGQVIKGVTGSNDEEPTYFKIVRSDIVLTTQSKYNAMTSEQQAKAVVWQTGINNFKGYMYFASSTAANGGITNESNYPLFASISSEGVVDRVYVKGTNTPSVSNPYSPFCNINNGTIIECHNKCAVTLANTQPLAGLCVTNNGKIIGGANEASLATEGHVAGICYTNNGLVQGNFSLSVAVPQGDNIAGIVYDNRDTVKDCQVSSSIPVNSTGNWGVIAYLNSANGVIDNCIATGTVVFTVYGSVGGICNTNRGVVCNCSNNVEIRASQGDVGGICALMDNASAEIYNCCSEGMHYIGGSIGSNIADNLGGIIGHLVKGKVFNCYNHSRVEGGRRTGGIVGVLEADEDAKVENCWSAYGHDFVGARGEGATLGVFCFSAKENDPGCNRTAGNSSVTIGTTTYNPFQVIYMIPGQDAATTYVGQHLSAPLNDWVNSHNSGGDAKYYPWTTTANIYPRFATGLNGKGKKSR